MQPLNCNISLFFSIYLEESFGSALDYSCLQRSRCCSNLIQITVYFAYTELKISVVGLCWIQGISVFYCGMFKV